MKARYICKTFYLDFVVSEQGMIKSRLLININAIVYHIFTDLSRLKIHDKYIVSLTLSKKKYI